MDKISKFHKKLLKNAQDITQPKYGVQVEIRNDKQVLWINVDGICVLRICQIPEIKFTKNGVKLN